MTWRKFGAKFRKCDQPLSHRNNKQYILLTKFDLDLRRQLKFLSKLVEPFEGSYGHKYIKHQITIHQINTSHLRYLLFRFLTLVASFQINNRSVPKAENVLRTIWIMTDWLIKKKLPQMCLYHYHQMDAVRHCQHCLKIILDPRSNFDLAF